ncbi:hypothetical protein KQI86_12325 [Clostridium sp. MSJ-11]|uniref:ABC-2 family transporter protein n=1 Tax=Clostridium mobile TaxID=2841512 RepID=A0ABS6EIU0_9CLOT|nr:hypothetical protein [Clostridium mobile]MBU5485121.1 hypothetical protein [Clostridium mobile]
MNTLVMDIRRSFLSIGFITSVIGTCFIYFLGDWIDILWGRSDVLTYFFISISIGRVIQFTILLSALPYTISFCTDWNSKYIRPCIMRTGVNKYGWSKVVSCYLSGTMSIALGSWLFIILLMFKFPLVSTSSQYYEACKNTMFGQFLIDGRHILYFAFRIHLIVMACGFFSVVGLYISTYLPNKFVALTSPFIVYYFLSQLGHELDLPWYLCVDLIIKGNFQLGGDFINIIYSTLLFAILTIFTGFLFVKGVRRRVSNG